MAKSLSLFMRDTEEKIVVIPGVDSIRDENGDVVDFEVKVLSNKTIRNIQNQYKKKAVAHDKKGNPLVSGGEVVFKSDYDSDRALRHIIAEALVYPNLKDKELQDFYKCYDIADLLLVVFSNPEEYNDVVRRVMIELGMISRADAEDENEKEIDDAKN